MKYVVASLAALVAASATVVAHSQFDAAAAEKWSKVTIVHYEVVGEINDKHVQIPPTDADLYADVFDRVTLSFDWDKKKQDFVGIPTFRNYPGKVSNLEGMEKGCPTGSINGPYEHFDIVEIKRSSTGAVSLIGKRVHPETSVAESCGKGRRLYKGAVVSRTEYIAPAPDPAMLALASMLPANGPVKVTPDGKSFMLTAQNDNWVWTYTPSVK